MRLATRAVLGLGGAALAVTGLSGCVLRQVSASQADIIGPVSISTLYCAQGSPGCTAAGNLDFPAATGTGQALLGYRIPLAADAPPNFLTSAPGVVLARDPAYAAELERLSPAPAGQQWVGYLSNTLNFTKNVGPQAFSATPQFTLRPAADGGPFTSPFSYQVVAGMRLVDAARPANRPVACGTSLTTFNSAGDQTICVDSPAPAVIPTNSTRTTRDLGVVPGAAESARAGTLASLAFSLRFSGTASATANFALSATSTLPGAVAAPNLSNLIPPTDSTTPIAVGVGIPAGAAPGTYDVTLQARLANGQTRTGTGRLTVTAAPPGGGGGGGGAAGGGGGIAAATRIQMVLPRRLTARFGRTRGIPALIGSSRVAVVRVQLVQRGRVLAARGTRLRSPGPTKVVLRSRLLRPGGYRVVVRGTGFTRAFSGVLRRP